MRAVRWRALGAALSLVCSSAPMSAQQLQIETTEHDEAVLVNATATMQVRPATAWNVISDYDHLAEFVPGMHSSRVLRRNGNQVLVEQKGSLGFLFFQQAIEIRLAVIEWPQQRIVARAVGGNLQQMDGSYTLETLDDGRVRLSYSGRLVPAFTIPAMLGKPVVRQLLTRQFKALVDEILRREALSLGSGNPSSNN
ncbi:SRPBCC family protein [Comamonas testosteroni]|uniref:SRPBCC family protein n=1 Tax=Comamonas testosteroni TaxID=285 RepID=UPI002DBABC2D|nr:SRPBCC family protein [Comamonas testosteroni]MEB5965301.1 SRPBCC family protein [Comamonas testosteroni]